MTVIVVGGVAVDEVGGILVKVGVRVGVRVSVRVGVRTGVLVGSVPVRVGMIGVMEGVISMGSKVQVGAFVRVGMGVMVGTAVRVGVGVTMGVSVKVGVIVAVNSDAGLPAVSGRMKLRYAAGIFTPGMEYPKYNRATAPMQATPSKVISNISILWKQDWPDERYLGCFFAIGKLCLRFMELQIGRRYFSPQSYHIKVAAVSRGEPELR